MSERDAHLIGFSFMCGILVGAIVLSAMDGNAWLAISQAACLAWMAFLVYDAASSRQTQEKE